MEYGESGSYVEGPLGESTGHAGGIFVQGELRSYIADFGGIRERRVRSFANPFRDCVASGKRSLQLLVLKLRLFPIEDETMAKSESHRPAKISAPGRKISEEARYERESHTSRRDERRHRKSYKAGAGRARKEKPKF